MSVIEETVTALWRRGLNTYDIADRTRVAETEVCRIIAEQTKPRRWVPVGEVLTTPRDRTIQIIREVAVQHDVTVDAIINGNRSPKNVAARREAIVALIAAKPHLSFPQIGRIFGLDHTTALHHAQVAGLRSRRDRND